MKRIAVNLIAFLLLDQFQNDLKDGFHDCGLLNFPAAGRFFNGFNHTGNTPIVKKQNTSAPQKKTESTVINLKPANTVFANLNHSASNSSQ